MASEGYFQCCNAQAVAMDVERVRLVCFIYVLLYGLHSKWHEVAFVIVLFAPYNAHKSEARCTSLMQDRRIQYAACPP